MYASSLLTGKLAGGLLRAITGNLAAGNLQSHTYYNTYYTALTSLVCMCRFEYSHANLSIYIRRFIAVVQIRLVIIPKHNTEEQNSRIAEQHSSI